MFISKKAKKQILENIEELRNELEQNRDHIEQTKDTIAQSREEIAQDKYDIVQSRVDIERNKQDILQGRADIEQTKNDILEGKVEMERNKQDLVQSRAAIEQNRKSIDKNQSDIQKSQDDIERIRQEMLENQAALQAASAVVTYTEEEKRKAAYALNLCTVSVSQIIAYNDLVVMEQEYDAIINNLNLEKIIKDEPLLNILKLIMNTITYFKMEDMEKQQIEKSYQRKMSNAIWSAIPSGALIMTRSPVQMALSLAMQIGTGYMNYRRTRCAIEDEREEALWKLQVTALEQFNGLQRELFEASWRLAETYHFPDSYRLTQKQLEEYNTILMDGHAMRRYERLYGIKKSFEAYPYYWYYLGHAANEVSRQTDLSDELRQTYKNQAIAHFRKFEEVDSINVLREDMIGASCYLEYAELLSDREKISGCLDKAREKCGNAYDVLQICACSYIGICAYEKAEPIMIQLVLADYNRKVNAQLLSLLYIRDFQMNAADSGNTVNRSREKYEVLSLLLTQDERNYLIPCTFSDQEDIWENIYQYLKQEKLQLWRKWKSILSLAAQKYDRRYLKCFPTGRERPDEYYVDDSYSELLKTDLQRFMIRHKSEYINILRERDFIPSVREVIIDMYEMAMNKIGIPVQKQASMYGTISRRLQDSLIKEIAVMISTDTNDTRNEDKVQENVQKAFRPISKLVFTPLSCYIEKELGIMEIYKSGDNCQSTVSENNVMEQFQKLSQWETAADSYADALHITNAQRYGNPVWEDQKLFPILTNDEKKDLAKNSENMISSLIEETLRKYKTRLPSDNSPCILYVNPEDRQTISNYCRIVDRKNKKGFAENTIGIFSKNHTDDLDYDLIFTEEGVYYHNRMFGWKLVRYGEFFKAEGYKDKIKNECLNRIVLEDIITEIRNHT